MRINFMKKELLGHYKLLEDIIQKHHLQQNKQQHKQKKTRTESFSIINPDSDLNNLIPSQKELRNGIDLFSGFEPGFEFATVSF